MNSKVSFVGNFVIGFLATVILDSMSESPEDQRMRSLLRERIDNNLEKLREEADAKYK